MNVTQLLPYAAIALAICAVVFITNAVRFNLRNAESLRKEHSEITNELADLERSTPIRYSSRRDHRTGKMIDRLRKLEHRLEILDNIEQRRLRKV